MKQEMDIQAWLEFTKENILVKSKAKEILGMSESAFTQAVSTQRLVPVIELGEGNRKIRLYLKSDVLRYKEAVEKKRSMMGMKK
ncbi:hypothetical protein [Paenibacillus larvae]|uniref:DNA-binding protein n=1 Tax=Paenibacillus larvae subsp. larvae TaxID=147375 RepID=A0A2L1U7H7_9BACL|nr:hypothetical protein [Paenibacillus larvae]AVF28871.1 hypothetical protein ERICIII_04869 [Paenibacillus larvae subsp. larvae]MCY9502432.1 hypothetical protein [Paenibacillus larvae]MCY9746370.1 hypothetical protein [Paenibacillus larvae]MCY9752088.1 hypothetical protein [Paenibacillus larvae]MDR5608766.1 hypothetical protein [Paenibacillus larvae]